VHSSDSYKTGKTLGEGAFAIVKEATKRGTDETFAVKIITKAKLTEEDELALKDEIGILTQLSHPNIIRLYEHFTDAKFYFLVTEEMHGGELFDRIVAKSYYNEKEARDTCKILFTVMAYLHSKNVAHRDLKPENLLLQSADDDTKVKLADFGFAKRTNGREDCLTTQCGTPGYVSPEIIEGVPYGTKTDMWSLGVICFIIMGGYPPFNDNDQRKLFEKIRTGKYKFHNEYWGGVSKDAKQLIAALMTVDRRKRMSADEALKSSWVTQDASELAKVDLGKNLEEFKKFNAKRKFKAAVRGVVAANMMKAFVGGVKASSLERKLTEEDVADLKETFSLFDKDGGGTISADELQSVMKKLGTNLSRAEVSDLIKQVDVNNDKEIDFDEFLSMMKKMPDTDKELENAFKVFDADGGGTTSKAELNRIMRKFGQVLSEAELDAVMKEVDVDGDGDITFKEFKQAMLA
jgi:serine/threonine protein kinase